MKIGGRQLYGNCFANGNWNECWFKWILHRPFVIQFKMISVFGMRFSIFNVDSIPLCDWSHNQYGVIRCNNECFYSHLTLVIWMMNSKWNLENERGWSLNLNTCFIIELNGNVAKQIQMSYVSFQKFALWCYQFDILCLNPFVCWWNCFQLYAIFYIHTGEIHTIVAILRWFDFIFRSILSKIVQFIISRVQPHQSGSNERKCSKFKFDLNAIHQAVFCRLECVRL